MEDKARQSGRKWVGSRRRQVSFRVEGVVLLLMMEVEKERSAVPYWRSDVKTCILRFWILVLLSKYFTGIFIKDKLTYGCDAFFLVDSSEILSFPSLATIDPFVRYCLPPPQPTLLCSNLHESQRISAR